MSFCDKINTPYGEKLLKVTNGDRELARNIYTNLNLDSDFYTPKKSNQENVEYTRELFGDSDRLVIKDSVSIADKILNNTNDELLKESLKLFKEVLHGTFYTSNTSLFSAMDNTTLGISSGNQFTIQSDKLSYNRNLTKEDINHIVVHELVHMATATKIDSDKLFKDELLKYKQAIPEHILNRYNITDEHEFVAELFSNKHFVDDLKTLGYNDKPFLSRVFDTILQFIGMNPKDNNNAYNHFKKLVIDNVPNTYDMFSETEHKFVIGENGKLSKELTEQFDKAKNVFKESEGLKGIAKTLDGLTSYIDKHLGELNTNSEFYKNLADKINSFNKKLSDRNIPVFMGYDGKLRYDIGNLGLNIEKSLEEMDGKTLKDIIGKDAPLIKMYERAADITIKVSDEKGAGYYDMVENVLALDKNESNEETKKTIRHELQHFIQTEERFTLGDSPENYIDDITSHIFLYTLYDGNKYKGGYSMFREKFIKLTYDYIVDSAKKLSLGTDTTTSFFKMTKDGDEIRKLAKAIKHFAKSINPYVVTRYYTTLGEIEARYAEDNHGMSYSEFYSNELSEYNRKEGFYESDSNILEQIHNFVYANTYVEKLLSGTAKDIRLIVKNTTFGYQSRYDSKKQETYYVPYINGKADNETRLSPHTVYSALYGYVQMFKEDFDNKKGIITFKNTFDELTDDTMKLLLAGQNSFKEFTKGEIYTISKATDMANKEQLASKFGLDPKDTPLYLVRRFRQLKENNKIIADNTDVKLINVKKFINDEIISQDEKTTIKKPTIRTKDISTITSVDANNNIKPSNIMLNTLRYTIGEKATNDILGTIKQIDKSKVEKFTTVDGDMNVIFIDDKGNYHKDISRSRGNHFKVALLNNKDAHSEIYGLSDDIYTIQKVPLTDFQNSPVIMDVLDKFNVIKQHNC